MKKRIFAAFCGAILALGLMGCEKPENPILEETQESQAIQQQENRRLFLELDENNRIDAEIPALSRMELAVYHLSMPDLTPEQLFGVFLPENSEGISRNSECSPGTLTYKKDSGAELHIDPFYSQLSFTADPEAAYSSGQESETASLLYYYSQAHPQAPAKDLSFMTAVQMQETAKRIVTRLGVGYEPEISCVVTLSGQEILDFQHEMYQDPSYTEMGSPYHLTEAEDACYLEIVFSIDGSPIYRPGEQMVSFTDGVMPPCPVSASLFMTEEGIRHFNMMYACTAEPAQVYKIISPEEAAQTIKKKYEQQIHFGEIIFDTVYLEYMPVPKRDGYVLQPYWCFDSPDYAERINAITGEDISYGG